MANQRLLVMNGQRVLQETGDNGKWEVKKTETAPTGMRPGIYNLSAAAAADKGATTEGRVIHVDAQSVYQQTDKRQTVKHDASAFEKQPSIGAAVSISYDGGKAKVDVAQTQSRSRSI